MRFVRIRFRSALARHGKRESLLKEVLGILSLDLVTKTLKV
jgi:hypothetical protein